MQNIFEDNTFKQFYYSSALSDEETSDNLIIEKDSLKRKPDEDLDTFFTFGKTKKIKRLQSSSVSRAQPNGVAYISTNQDDILTSTHLIKIEIYDLKKIAKIPIVQRWKHASTRIKYYANDANVNSESIKNTIFDITKEIASKESSKNMFFKNADN